MNEANSSMISYALYEDVEVLQKKMHKFVSVLHICKKHCIWQIYEASKQFASLCHLSTLRNIKFHKVMRSHVHRSSLASGKGIALKRPWIL